jgi:hypothetical protein
MVDFFPTTWGNWDVRCLNAVMKAPELAEVRIIAYDRRSRVVVEEMRWEALARFGGHSQDGQYSDIDLKCLGAVFRLEFAADDSQFTYKISPVVVSESLCFLITGLFRWNAAGKVERLEDSLVLSTTDQRWTISVEGQHLAIPINTTHQGLLVAGTQPVYIRCNHALAVQAMDQLIADKKAAWLAECLRGGGMLEDAPQAVVKGILWNTIYEPIKQRFCTPVTREWCIIQPERPWFGSYVLFAWDTCFASLLAGLQNEALAYRQLYSLMEEFRDGTVPLLGSEINTYSERSQPPVGSYCALKLFRQYGSLSFLEKIFPTLLAWHAWWMPHRDGNGDGLLEWGTDLPITHNDLKGYLGECKSESGLDNSPMYDETVFNPATHTMELADIGLNALYALDCWSLSELANILGRHDEAGRLRAEYQVMADRINTDLWDEQQGIYCNKHWDGHFSAILGPTCFYPLLAGIAPRQRAERMLREHLLNVEEFWGEYVIPVSPKNHPSFADNDYWRGRIWAPTNFLVAEGLKRAGFYEEAYAVAQKSLQLFLKEWNEESHIHENYNTLTGDGDDVWNADRVYTWGGLLAYLGISEVIEVQPEGGLRLGNLSGEDGQVERFSFQGTAYTVQTGAQLRVDRDGCRLLETSCPARITQFRIEDGTLSFTVDSPHGCKIKVYPAQGIRQVIVTSAASILSCQPDTEVEFAI